jgi:uncharacterized protein (TIGR03382 family)
MDYASTMRARIVAIVLFGTASAHAFCRTTSQAPAPSFQPTGDACWTKGLPVWWKDSCVGYEIEASGGNNLPEDTVAQVAATSFAAWTTAQCGSGTITMTVTAGTPVPLMCTAVGYVKGAKNNVNEIIFHDDAWPYNDGVNTIALTTLTFNSDTGQILDADIELNSASGMITTTTPTATTFDLQSVLTHETGHFFGLAHSGHTEATMFSMYKPASTSMRVLATDDISGICSLYGTSARPTATGAVASECNAPARGTYDGMCPAPKSGGCNASGSPTSWFAALVTALLLSARRIRSPFLGRRRATTRS